MASTGITDQRIDGPRVRRMSDNGRAWLVRLEGGCKIKAYLDSAGIPTIGVGMTYWLSSGSVRKRVEMGDRLSTEAEGLAMFERALRDYEAAVDAATRDDITQTEFDAFSSLCYNIGQRAFTGSSVVRFFNARTRADQVVSALKLWNRAGGRVDAGLVERRACEADLLLKGIYRTQRSKALA